MFEVRTSSPLDERWEERDDEILAAAGYKSSFSGAGLEKNGMRDHGWFVPTFDQAQELKAKLEIVADVNVTIREKTTTYIQKYKR